MALGSVVVALGSGAEEAVAVVQRLNCSATCGIVLDQGSNPCFRVGKADSSPLSHQGSLAPRVFKPFLLWKRFPQWPWRPHWKR